MKWAALVMFKMKNALRNSGRVNKNFRQPVEKDRMEEFFEMMKKRREAIAPKVRFNESGQKGY